MDEEKKTAKHNRCNFEHPIGNGDQSCLYHVYQTNPFMWIELFFSFSWTFGCETVNKIKFTYVIQSEIGKIGASTHFSFLKPTNVKENIEKKTFQSFELVSTCWIFTTAYWPYNSLNRISFFTYSDIGRIPFQPTLQITKRITSRSSWVFYGSHEMEEKLASSPEMIKSVLP